MLFTIYLVLGKGSPVCRTFEVSSFYPSFLCSPIIYFQQQQQQQQQQQKKERKKTS